MAAQLWSTFSSPLFTAANYVGKGGVTTIGPGSAVATPDGVNVMCATFSTAGTSVSASISDVVVMCLLPEGAVVIGGFLAGRNLVTGTAIKVGIGAAGVLSSTGVSTDGDFLAATTFTTSRTVTPFGTGAGGLPYRPAAIAAATYPKWYPVIATVVSGSICLSLCFSVTLIYSTGNQGVT